MALSMEMANCAKVTLTISQFVAGTEPQLQVLLQESNDRENWVTIDGGEVVTIVEAGYYALGAVQAIASAFVRLQAVLTDSAGGALSRVVMAADVNLMRL